MRLKRHRTQVLVDKIEILIGDEVTRRRAVSLKAEMTMENTLDKARQVRDEMVKGSVKPIGSPARHIYKIYPEADDKGLPKAMENLLGACSGICP